MRTATDHYQHRSLAWPIAIFIVGGLSALALANLSAKLDWAPFAAIYAVAFMTFAWRRRTLAMALVYLSALFPFDVGGGAFVAIGIAEAHLALVTALLLLDFVFNRSPLPHNPLYVPVAFYLAISILSSMNVSYGKDTYISIAQMFLYFIVTTAVFSNFIPDARQHLRVVAGVVVGGVFLAISEAIFVLGSSSQYVFGMHKNAIGGALSYAFIITLELWFITADKRRKGLLGLAFLVISVGLFLSLSRGGWLCGTVGIMAIILLRGQLGLLIRSVFIIAPILFICWQFLPEDQRGYAFGFSTDQANILARLESITIARAFFENHPYIGFGVGLRKIYDATNVIWLTLAETGLFGLIGFLGIHLTFLFMVIRARTMISTRDPRFSLLAIGLALVFGKLVHGCVDHYWSRGSLLVVWGGAGMAVAAYNSAVRDYKLGLSAASPRGFPVQ